MLDLLARDTLGPCNEGTNWEVTELLWADRYLSSLIFLKELFQARPEVSLGNPIVVFRQSVL